MCGTTVVVARVVVLTRPDKLPIFHSLSNIHYSLYRRTERLAATIHQTTNYQATTDRAIITTRLINGRTTHRADKSLGDY